MELADIKNSFKWNMLLLPVITAVGLVTNVFLARQLSLSTYAVFMILMSFKSTFLGAADLGMSTSYTKFYYEVHHKNGQPGAVHFTAQILGLKALVLTGLLVLLIVFHDIAVDYFKLESVPSSGLLLVVSLIVLEAVSNAFERYLEVNLRQKSLNTIKLLQLTTFIVMLALFARLGELSISSALYSLVASTALKAAALLAVFYRQTEGGRTGAILGWLRQNVGRFIKTSATIYFDKMSSTLMNLSFLILIIAPHFNKTDVAYLALAGNFVSKTIALLLFPTSGLILPIFSHYYAYKSDSGLNSAHGYSAKYMGFIFLLSAGLVLTNATQITMVLYSSRYLPSVVYIMWLLPIMYIEQAVLNNIAPSFYVKESYLVYWGNRIIVILGMVGIMGIIRYNAQLTLLEIVGLFAGLKCLNVCMLLYANTKINKLGFPWMFYAKMILVVAVSTAASYALTANVHNVVAHIAVSTAAYIAVAALGMRLVSLVDEADWQTLSDVGLPFVKQARWILG